MWIIYSFLTAFFETGKDVIGKNLTHKTNVLLTAFSVQFFSLLILVPLTLIVGIPQIQPQFWFAMALASLTIPSANLLYMRAIKLSPLSVALPILAFNPIITALFSFFFDQKIPDISGWLGIVLVCLGLYLSRINQKLSKTAIFEPIISIRHEPGTVSMLGVSLIWALGAHVSKMAILNSSAFFTALVFSIVGTITIFLIGKLTKRFDYQLLFNNLRQLSMIGILDSFSQIFMNLGLTTGLTPYVISIKRSNIVWSSLMGKLFYNEQFSRIKLIGIILMFAGIILILL